MSKIEGFTTSELKKNPKDSLQGLRENVEELTPQQKAERKVGNHIKDILKRGAYLKKAVVDGKEGEILNARTQEEAVNMVNDLVSNFEHSLKKNPKLFDGLHKPVIFDATYKEMFIFTHEDGNLYWDVDVIVNGDDVKVVAPVRLAG